MEEFRLPLSGDVTQSINPWTMFFRAVGSQFGLININLGKSSDPVLEQRVLDQVGSYGRQIGQLGDALRVLIDHVDRSTLSATEKTALDAAQFQLGEIDRLKMQRRQERANDTKLSSW